MRVGLAGRRFFRSLPWRWEARREHRRAVGRRGRRRRPASAPGALGCSLGHPRMFGPCRPVGAKARVRGAVEVVQVIVKLAPMYLHAPRAQSRNRATRTYSGWLLTPCARVRSRPPLQHAPRSRTHPLRPAHGRGTQAPQPISPLSLSSHVVSPRAASARAVPPPRLACPASEARGNSPLPRPRPKDGHTPFGPTAPRTLGSPRQRLSLALGAPPRPAALCPLCALRARLAPPPRLRAQGIERHDCSSMPGAEPPTSPSPQLSQSLPLCLGA